MRRPLVVVTGVSPRATSSLALILTLDLPDAVVVRHRIDPEQQVLSRVVSDSTGILERAQTTLAHACVTCALREDILPTLERLARNPQWGAIISVLPAGAEATQLGAAITHEPRFARLLKVSSVVTAVGSERPIEDLIGDGLLRDHGRHFSPDDDRGVGEVACAQVEYADVIVAEEPLGPNASDLVRALARPNATLIDGAVNVDGTTLTKARHSHAQAMAWHAPVADGPLPDLAHSRAWRLDLSSHRPFHPERLLDRIELLGGGEYRSRGCFWVPSRPNLALEWAGSGGQLSIGIYNEWENEIPRTRLIFTGLGSAPTHLGPQFEEALASPSELRSGAFSDDVLEDGLEPWLGDISDISDISDTA